MIIKKSIFGSIIIAYLLVIVAYAESNIIYIKSDSSWKAASDTQLGLDWTKTEFDDSSWGSSSAKWANNPCSANNSYYCVPGRMNACTVSCKDWMWYGDSCDNCSRYFRTGIIIPGDVESASIRLSADDAYWLYVNGNPAGSEVLGIAYMKAEPYDISKYLHKGPNTIAIKVYQKDKYEGVAVNGEIRFKSVDPVINQMQSKLDILQSQVNTLNEDKTRLNAQIDALQSQITALNSNKEDLVNQISDLQSQRISDGKTREELEKKLSLHRMINLILMVILILPIVICYYLYLQNKKLYRKPTLSSVPIKTGEIKK